MPAKLILSKAELNPDVFFSDPGKWTIGSDWTVFLNSQPGAVVSSATGTFVSLTNTPLKYSTSYKYKIFVQTCTGSNTILFIGPNTINIPLSLSPQVLDGIVSTDTVYKDVGFFSFGGDNAIINQLTISESPSSFEIDITDDIDVPLNYSIADIKDPSKRNAAYSKQITIPATKNNNRYFTHIYEISGDGSFNPNKKCRAQVVEDGIEVFNGISQLKTITRQINGLNNYVPVSYDIVLLGKLADLFYLLGDTLLSDLDFSEFDHIYNITNQRDSWYTQIQKNGSNYSNFTNGGNLTITSCANNLGRLQINFSGSHGLAEEDWILIPDNSITAGSEFYYGEHWVEEIVSSTSIIVRCPFDVLSGNTLTTTNTVKKHIKKGEGYVYPMCDYGAVTGNTWKVNNFYPAIYVKQYIDKIFKKIGFVYDSSFFNWTMFKKLIISYNGGELKLTQEQVDAKLFRASSTNLVSGSYLISGNYDTSGNYAFPQNYRGHSISGFGVGPGYTPFSNTPPVTLDIPIDDDTTIPNFDNGGTFNTGSFRWTCPVSGNYDLITTVMVKHNFVLPVGVTQQETTDTPPIGITAYKFNINYDQSFTYGGAPKMQLQIYDYTASAFVIGGTASIPGFQASSTAQSINTFSTFLTAGHQYGVRLVYQSPAKGQFWSAFATTPYSGNITVNYQIDANAVFKNNITNAAIGDGDQLLMNMCVPQKIKCQDFLKSIIKLFNLYVQPDETNDKKLYIETRNNFYSLGGTKIWTSKLDTDEKLTITPMGELNFKKYEFKYAEDKAPFGADHKLKYGIGYGDYTYTIDNDFLPDSTNTIDVIFASSVLAEVVQGAGSGRIISQTLGEPLRILFFNTSSTVNQVPNNTWTHSGLTGSFSRRIFPYAGHLDKVEAPNYDMNWNYPRGVYFDYDSWTNRNLVNQFYKQMIEETTDKNSRLVSGYFHLTAKDIFNLDFRDLFVVDGHFLRLNKVNDYLVNKNLPVLCEFIKVEAKAPYVAPRYTSALNNTPVFNQTARVLNANENPSLAMDNNTSNAYRKSSGVEIMGEGNNVNNIGSKTVVVRGDNNTVGAYSTNIFIQGDGNTVDPGLSNVSLINTSNQTITESNVSYVNGINVTDAGTVTPSITLYSNTTLDRGYHNKTVYLDGSAGDFTVTWDSANMQDVRVFFVRIDATGTNITFTDLDATASIDGVSVPVVLLPANYDKMVLTSTGNKIYTLSIL